MASGASRSLLEPSGPGSRANATSLSNSPRSGNVGDQVTLQKTLSAANLQPGMYRIEIKVNDNISKQTVGPTATFSVE